MAAPKLNKFYKLRKTSGRGLKYTGQELRDKAIEYFNLTDSNPIKKEKILKYSNKYEKVCVNIPRPFSISGFCVHAGLSRQTFNSYCRQKNTEIREAAFWIRMIIYDQLFQGGCTGVYNERFVYLS